MMMRQKFWELRELFQHLFRYSIGALLQKKVPNISSGNDKVNTRKIQKANTITSRLDYCNSVLYGVPDYHMQKLQSVMNTSVRLIFCEPKHCDITPLLKQLHWLPIRLRIEFKILLITFKLLEGSAPKYLISLLTAIPLRFTTKWKGDASEHSKALWGIDPS